jgi:mono/diheme cytochrome c family protein
MRYQRSLSAVPLLLVLCACSPKPEIARGDSTAVSPPVPAVSPPTPVAEASAPVAEPAIPAVEVRPPVAEPATPVAAARAPVSEPPPLRDAYHVAPRDTVDGKTYSGWKYYNLNCARCHGEDVQGTSIAPHLLVSLRPDGAIPNEGEFLKVVCGGRVEKGMPAWCAQGMSTAQIDTIYAYVHGRSAAKLHAGRPARRE